tara:strand:- start:4 stop:1083 length:1080 start_codon:yes stop_codon:yes gene_type:complete
MKIAIVGAGNAGCITALHYHKYLDIDNEIVIYHSPEQHPIERVGQGTFPTFVDLIANTLDINWYDNPIDATFKSGILYEGWGKISNKFFHPFSMEQMSIHFVPQKLSKVVLESGYFKVIEQTITDPEKEIDADVIFDCRGRHNRDDSNYDTLVNPLNSVLLYKKEGKDPDLLYTRAIATPNGWTFVIPNKDSISYGYLYNNTITSKEDARKDFLDRFDLPEVDGELTFENYMAKNMFVGERTVLQGNRYGFIEPLEASSLGIYQSIARQSWDGIFGIKDLSYCNAKMKVIMKEIETFILWNYQHGSKYDTPFWKYAKSLPFNPDERFDIMLNNPKEDDVYGQWTPWSFKIFKKHYHSQL